MRARTDRGLSITRRRLLGVPIAAAVAGLQAQPPAPASLAPPGAPDTTRGPGAPASAAGTRAPSVLLTRAVSGMISATPLHALEGTITPSDLHYEVHRAGIPAVDPVAYRLLVHGLVDRPRVFTLEDLKRLPAITRTCFLECGGNYPRNATGAVTPQTMAGLTSQSEWTGVPLSVLFGEVGLRPEAGWFLAEGQDGVAMTRSAPIEEAIRIGGMLAYAQNGEPLRPAQGFPVRLLLPGWEGVASVKWLRRLDVGTGPFMTREETSRYTEEMADGTIRQFSLELDARSIITAPAPPATMRPGYVEIRGLAWSGRGRIARVEISTDDGRRWRDAALDGPVLPRAHVRFRLPWRWDGTPATLLSRAIDDTGYVQPTVAQLLAERGVASPSYHMNPIVGWRVAADGRLSVKEEPWR